MKKLITLFLSLLISSLLFSNTYKITDIDFNIEKTTGLTTGKTQENIILMKYPIDTEKEFTTKEELESYLENYKKELITSRFFQTVNINYEAIPELVLEDNIEEDTIEENTKYNVIIHINLQDSNSLIIVPFPEYSTNKGLMLELILLDTNFLGSMEQFAGQLVYNITPEEKHRLGLNIYNEYPFKAGIFDGKWVNGLFFNYQFGETTPIFTATTGVDFSLPLNKISIDFGLHQTAGYDLIDKIDITDTNYYPIFREKLKFSTPVVLHKFSNYSDLSYIPKVDFNFNWHLDNKIKTPLIDEINLEFGHSLSNSKVTYKNQFRKGYNIKVENNYTYDIKHQDFYPDFSLEAIYYDNFELLKGPVLNGIGISARAYAYTSLSAKDRQKNSKYANIKPGEKIRGILDKRITTPDALIFNLDIPVSIFTTSFPWKMMNFNMQFAPFIDIAFIYNEETKTPFSLEEGIYCAGFEILLNPLNFSTFTLRISYGIDLKTLINEKKTASEMFVGMGYFF